VHETNTQRSGTSLYVLEFQFMIVPFVVEKCDASHPGKQVLEQAKSLADEIGRNTRKTRRVSTRAPQAAQEFFERIATDHNNRNIFSLLFRRQQRCLPADGKYIDLEACQFAGKNWQLVVGAVGEARFDYEVSSFLVAKLVQRLAKHLDPGLHSFS
jgi:hypothetical protein